ncbi:hypothetical protein OB920_11980 [Halobacteria archaeon HArc-gm2]|nr:hypothetical protein [Halobacteria archaeon HArc-gm2]
MSRVLKLAAVVATVAALGTIFAPALWRVSHGQALTNVLVGEFATLAMGYTAYRIAYGKDASRSVALAAAVFGAVLAVSPVVFGLVPVFTSVTMIGGGLVAVVSLVAFVTTFTGDDRSVRGISRGRDASDDQPEAV